MALNAQAQAALKKMGSVWQYYQLIDTQWPTEPGAAPSGDGGLPGAGDATSPAVNPTPTFLTNITMETYFQEGNQAACNSEEMPERYQLPQTGSAVEPLVWNSALNNLRASR